MGAIRKAAVAGTFYPGESRVLRSVVNGFLEEARRRPRADLRAPKALVVPHAGYVYSGAVAASSYARLRGLAGRISRVVLLGPCHRVAVRGIALPETGAFETPLGVVEIDAEAVAAIAGLPGVVASAAAHAQDHALEVQLPFLQQVLGAFRLVPLLVGQVDDVSVAHVIERLWGGEETLVVVSSDLSHYLPYAEACESDRATVDAVLAFEPRIDHAHACGATPVNALIEVARRHGLTPVKDDLRNSGDTAGDRHRVVGYAAIAFLPAADAARDASAGNVLVGLARAAIAERFGGAPAVTPPGVAAGPAATFVTLTLDGRLRGCIGSLTALRDLADDVRHNARAAAFQDPRFPPLTADEFARIRIEVSLLSPPETIAFRDEAELIDGLKPGEDGLVLEWQGRRATFLPQVWEALPDPREFLAQLKLKAGLARDFQAVDLRVSRYTVRKWKE
jgi:AmmeMemoRadiSam system protein B/AmmeMemoRadiSam system protein A